MLELKPSSLVINEGRLSWFGDVERKNDADRVKRCIMMETGGIRKKDHLRKTWWNCVKEDMKITRVL